MDNNLNGVPVAPQPAPVPAKKSHVGLIIGLVVLLLVVVGGFLAAFFLYIKPNFIDGGGSSSEEKEEEKTWSEIYASYLKKELDEDEAEIAFIDFDNDDTPEMIVSVDSRIQEIDYIKKNKVNTIAVKKSGEVDLLYNKDTEKEEWYLVDTSYGSNTYYSLKDTVKDEGLAAPEMFTSEAAAKKKYASLVAEVKYEEVTGKTASKVAKSLAKEDGYKTGKSVSDIKKEIEEANKEHKIVCIDKQTDGSTLTYNLTFKQNLLSDVEIVLDIDAAEVLSKEDEQKVKDNLAQTFGSSTSSITVENTSGKHYKVTVQFTIDKFIEYSQINVKKEELTFESRDDFVKSFENGGTTCKVD